MKRLLMFIVLGLSQPCFACDYQDVVLVDKEECEFLGKIIGTEYACVDIKAKTFKLYNRGKENLGIEIAKNDGRYQIVPREKFLDKNIR